MTCEHNCLYKCFNLSGLLIHLKVLVLLSLFLRFLIFLFKAYQLTISRSCKKKYNKVLEIFFCVRLQADDGKGTCVFVRTSRLAANMFVQFWRLFNALT